MVSPELIRRYPFFSDLSEEELQLLAVAGSEVEIDKGTVLFRRNDRLEYFYVVVEGSIDVTIAMTARHVTHEVSDQLTGDIETEDVVCSSVIPGEVFAWCALFPPYTATAGAKTAEHTRLIRFNASELIEAFEYYNSGFGYKMTQKLACVIKERLQDRRVELLSHIVNIH